MFVGLALLTTACAREGSTPATPALPELSATQIGSTDGLRTPESARYDPDLDVFYIANIDGNPVEKDGNGFIAVVPAESLNVMRVLVRGGEKGVTLSAPMGMALTGDTLWVVDVDAVRGFDRRTGAPLAAIDVSSQQPMFLNDLAAGPNGALYLTDTGVRFGADGNVATRGEGRIYRITNGTVSTVARGDAFASPNGITWQDTTGLWLIAPTQRPEVLTWSEGDSLPGVLATGPGSYDGIEAMPDGRILVTSWTDSAVHLISQGQMTVLIPNVNAPADLAYDMEHGIVAVPLLSDNRVVFFRLTSGSQEATQPAAGSRPPQ